MLVKLLQSLNAYTPILLMLFGGVTFAKALQPSKVPYSIDVTPLGIVMFVRLLQSPNANKPIDVTLSGISKLFKLRQSLNALALTICVLLLMLQETILLLFAFINAKYLYKKITIIRLYLYSTVFTSVFSK